MKNIKLIYKPAWISVVNDIMILILSLFVVLEWFPLTTRTPYQKYDVAAVLYVFIWVCVSYLLGRYKSLHRQKYLKASFKLMYITLIVFGAMWLISFTYFNSIYSVYVIFTFTTIAFAINFLFFILYFALLYAVDYDEAVSEVEVRENAVLKPATRLDDDSYLELCSTISGHSGKKVLDILSQTIDFQSGNTYVNFSTNYLDIKSKQNYKYSTIVHLERLNNVRGINKMFSAINQKLPDDGRFICCFESKSTRKKRILRKNITGLNYIFYTFDFVFKRFIPKLFITRRLYYDITKGKNRILSKTEVLGRLYYCGFEVIGEKKIGQLNYVYTRRKKQPEPAVKRSYGPMIRLRRLGKDGKMFEVYKMRTMHPYSEYLQAYIYERNQLQDGGKFNKDIRVTTLGRIMRRYWLDELPMIFNLLMGDMKIVGVRPLSAHYYSLYSKELQEKRNKFKPGLLPPFYADMPRTIEEIQESEMKYLNECEKRGDLRTDFRYFFLILKNILVRKARSA